MIRVSESPTTRKLLSGEGTTAYEMALPIPPNCLTQPVCASSVCGAESSTSAARMVYFAAACFFMDDYWMDVLSTRHAIAPPRSEPSRNIQRTGKNCQTDAEQTSWPCAKIAIPHRLAWALACFSELPVLY